MVPVILIHYHEIALKGKNRSFFEDKLIGNIKKATGAKRVEKDFGRLVIKLDQEDQFRPLSQQLTRIFGLANFSPAWETAKNYPQIKKSALQLIKTKVFSSFRVTAHRGDKNFPLTSQEINEKLGRAITLKRGGRVKLKDPQLNLQVEIGQKKAYLYFKKTKGLGGLPVSTAGKVFCLLSGGIDSPVAAYQMIKRGAGVDFVHFHSYPKTDQASIEKTKQLVKVLNQYQFEAQLYLIPFLDFQKEAFKKTDHRFLVVLYRRAMFQIAQKIASENGCMGLVTGESLGQVASQTLANMAVASRHLTMPVYRPLIGQDKQEVIDLAKSIGTYEISIEPHQDCCSLFVPKHPATKTSLTDILKEEKKIAKKKIIEELLKKTKKMKIS